MRAKVGGSAKHIAKVPDFQRMDGRKQRGYWIMSFTQNDFSNTYFFDGYRLMNFRRAANTTSRSGIPAWHPSGRAVAVNGFGDNVPTVYGVENGMVVHRYASPATVSSGTANSNSSPAWHPSGRAIVMGTGTTPFIDAWEFDLKGGFGAKYPDPADVASSCRSCAKGFSPDGRHVVAISTSTSVYVYEFDPRTGFGARYVGTCTTSSEGVLWFPDGTQILIYGASGGTGDFLPFTPGSGLGAKTTVSLPLTGTPTAADWDGFRPRRQGMEIIINNSTFEIVYPDWSSGSYSTNITRMAPLHFGPMEKGDSAPGINSGGWSPDGKFFAGRCNGPADRNPGIAVLSCFKRDNANGFHSNHTAPKTGAAIHYNGISLANARFVPVGIGPI